MKKMFSLMLLTSVMCFTSCSNEEDVYIPQEVEFTLDYTFVESGSMTRATGADVYNEFYEKYIKTKQLTPATYSLIFTNQETGATATINGMWDKKDGIRLPEGTYNVTGTSTPIENEYREWSDSVYIVFNETVSIKKDDTQLTLSAIYDSFLLMLDTENTKNVYCRCNGLTSSKEKLSHNDKQFWVFMQNTCRNSQKNNWYYLVVKRNNGEASTIKLLDIPFEKGKYYYFNDMTNSFDIPKMESGS